MDLAVEALCMVERPDRRVAVERELRRAGLEYRVFEATRPSESLGFSSPGRRGCFESHLTLIRRARDEGRDALIICQDDLWIARSFRRVWPSILTTIGQIDWQFLNLGYIRGFHPSVGAPLERVGPHVARLHAYELLCAHFHAIHSSVFDDLIAFLDDIHDNGPRPYDGSLDDFRRTHGYLPLVAIPNLGEQRPSPSNITASSTPFSTTLHTAKPLRPVLAGWRVARRAFFEIDSWAGARRVRYSPSPAIAPPVH